jgi:hypothetical protein
MNIFAFTFYVSLFYCIILIPFYLHLCSCVSYCLSVYQSPLSSLFHNLSIFYVCVSLQVSLRLSKVLISLSLYVVPLYLPFSVSQSLCSINHSLFHLSLFLPLSLSPSLSFSASTNLSISVSSFLSFLSFLSFYLHVSLVMFLCTCISVSVDYLCLSVFLSFCQVSLLPISLSLLLFFCLSVPLDSKCLSVPLSFSIQIVFLPPLSFFKSFSLYFNLFPCPLSNLSLYQTLSLSLFDSLFFFSFLYKMLIYYHLSLPWFQHLLPPHQYSQLVWWECRMPESWDQSYEAFFWLYVQCIWIHALQAVYMQWSSVHTYIQCFQTKRA